MESILEGAARVWGSAFVASFSSKRKMESEKTGNSRTGDTAAAAFLDGAGNAFQKSRPLHG